MIQMILCYACYAYLCLLMTPQVVDLSPLCAPLQRLAFVCLPTVQAKSRIEIPTNINY